MLAAVSEDVHESAVLAKYPDNRAVDRQSTTNNLPLQFMVRRAMVHRRVIEAVGGFYSEKLPPMLELLVRYASFMDSKHPRLDKFKVASAGTVSTTSSDEDLDQAVDFELSGFVQGILQGWTPLFGNLGTSGGTAAYRVIEQG